VRDGCEEKEEGYEEKGCEEKGCEEKSCEEKEINNYFYGFKGANRYWFAPFFLFFCLHSYYVLYIMPDNIVNER